MNKKLKYNLPGEYNYHLEPWFSPGIIIRAHVNLHKMYSKQELENGLFQRADEMLTAALAVTGALALHPSNQYILQPNNQTDTPDVVVATLDSIGEGKSELGIHRFEIVEFGMHTETDDIIDFLLQTKLSPKKHYTKNDWIVILVNKTFSLDPNLAIEKLKTLNPLPTIYAIGRLTDASPGVFHLTSLYPYTHPPKEFNIHETLKQYTGPDSQILAKGRGENMETRSMTKTTVDVYEILGLNRSKIDNKFGVRK